MKRLVLISLALCACTMRAQNCQSAYSHCLPGDVLTISSQTFVATDPSSSLVTLAPISGTGSSFSAQAIPGAASGFSFTIPAGAQDGTYAIKVKRAVPSTGTGVPSSTADLTDLAPAQVVIQHPSITAVSPAAAFRGDQKLNKVTIIGSGFNRWQDGAATRETEPTIRFRFLDRPTPAPCPEAGTATHCVKIVLIDDHTIVLSFYGLEANDGFYAGPMKFVVDVDHASTATANLALIDSSAQAPILWAAAFFALILGTVFFILYKGKKELKQQVSDRTYFLSALFLDVPTNTYSLSKCQFYAWTAASVLGYLYLAFSENFVQGGHLFPDIPSGLPGILLASAGTAVISAGLTSARGDKGAGNPGPNLSDFISSGGVVAADRLQFVVWTIVGIGTFLSIVVLSDPRSISDLPTIPPGFLQLMGISSAGYIAGKLARKPGPTINAIAVTGTPDKMTFQLTGSGLSRSALFSIDQTPVYPDLIVDKNNQPGLPEIVQSDPTINDPDYARVLAVTIAKASADWLGGPHNFTITNPDAQRAVWPFQIFKIDTIKIDSASGKMLIGGACLDSNLKVSYAVGVGASTSAVRTNDVKNATQYEATLTGVAAGPITVTVSDDSGMTTVRNEVAT